MRYNGNFPPMLFVVPDTSQASDWRTELLHKKNTHPYLNKISHINIVVSTVERPESLRRTVIGARNALRTMHVERP